MLQNHAAMVALYFMFYNFGPRASRRGGDVTTKMLGVLAYVGLGVVAIIWGLRHIGDTRGFYTFLLGCLCLFDAYRRLDRADR